MIHGVLARMVKVVAVGVLSLGAAAASAQTAAVTLYGHVGYGGAAVSLPPGAYTLSALEARGVQNDWVSSLKVSAGYEAVLFEDDGYGGAMLTKLSDASDLRADGFNDTLSSLYVLPASQDQRYYNGPDSLRLLNVGQLPADTVSRVVSCWRQYTAMKNRFNPSARTELLTILDPSYDGYAGTANGIIRIGAQKLVDNPWDADMQTHEQMHVIQAYTADIPGWIVEGLADWARYRYGLYNWQSGWAPLDPPGPGDTYDVPYAANTRFFVWLEQHKRSSFPVDLDAACRNGTYSPSFWTAEFGKTVDQLWAEYVANPAL